MKASGEAGEKWARYSWAREVGEGQLGEGRMRSGRCFRDEVQVLSGWFSAWSACEQVVALYSLLRRLDATQLRFIAQVVTQLLHSGGAGTACIDTNQAELRANDPGEPISRAERIEIEQGSHFYAQ